ncbi:MAG TPA: hypothetical protein VJ803_09400 [Gemmatimonadaceae bacterium]|nr:hypothetical protein [Gemmatimonadaceae bacterium]
MPQRPEILLETKRRNAFVLAYENAKRSRLHGEVLIGGGESRIGCKSRTLPNRTARTTALPGRR